MVLIVRENFFVFLNKRILNLFSLPKQREKVKKVKKKG